jgi:hypothetical protein
MKRVTDFRTGELRIPASMFPLPGRVQNLLNLSCPLKALN